MTVHARIAVVGAGWWSSHAHLPALVGYHRAELAGVCDPDESRAARAALAFETRGYTDIATLISEERPDGVIVATPHSTHFEVAKGVLEAGCHALVEKPLATTAADAWSLVTASERSARLLAVGVTYQYAATAPAVRMAVRDQIGELRCVNGEFSSSTQELFAITDPARANLSDPTVPHGTTYSDPSTGGGQAHTQLSHLLGAMLWASDRSALDVSAVTAQHGLAVDVVDALSFSLEGGALGVASSTGTTAAGVPVRHCIRFHGTRGMVEWDMLAANATVFREGGRVELLSNPPNLPSYRHRRVATAFVDSILDGTPSPAPGVTAAASVALIEAALTSAESGQRTPVAQRPDERQVSHA